MHRLLPCVLMITLLLSSCAGSGSKKAAESAVLFRNGLNAAETIEYSAKITADLDDTVFECSVLFAYERGGDAVVTLTEPECVAGVSARKTPKGASLEYDGVILDVGEPDKDGLSPASALCEMLDVWQNGYVTETALTRLGEAEAVLITFHPEVSSAGEELVHTLYICPEALAPLYAEIAVDGRFAVGAEFQ